MLALLLNIILEVLAEEGHERMKEQDSNWNDGLMQV